MNGTIRYTIRPYDTIWMLAQVFNTTVDSIMELNPGIDPRNLFTGQVITIRPGYQYMPPSPDRTNDLMNDDDMAFMDDVEDIFQILWMQHSAWTRMAMMAIVNELPDTEMILKRLLRNATDFANVLVQYYGEEPANEFGKLMSDHLTIAAEIFRAAKAGNNQAMAEANVRWHQNADQIAEFLASVNPYWSVEDWSAMMNEHLDLLSENLAAYVAGDYEASVNGADDIEMQVLEMADMMMEGINMQFPG